MARDMTAALLLALSLLQADPAAAAAPPAEPSSADAKPAESTPPDPGAAEPRAAEAADSKPAEPKPADVPPAEAKPSEPPPPAGPAAAEAATSAPAAAQAAPQGAAPAAPVANGEPVAPPSAIAVEPTPPPPPPPPPATPSADPVAAAGAVAPVGAGDVCVSPDPASAAPADPGLALIGYRFGIGFPEFGTASLIVRPLRWLRAGGGITWNYAGYGLRGEVTLAPLRWYISPTLNLAYGRYLKMDATKAGSLPAEVQGLAASIGYQYLDATLGIELGNQRHGMLVLQVGASRIWLDAPGTATFDATASGGGSTATTTIEATGLSVKGYAPAASLSWIIFL